MLHFGEDGFLYAGTYGNGIFRSASTVAIIRSILGNGLKAHIFHEMYPTILSYGSTAHISITIDKPGKMEIKVYDGLGRVTVDLNDSYYTPGSYTVPFTVPNYNSGVYYYRILFGGKSYVKPFVVLN
jgi:hypothetical protein